MRSRPRDVILLSVATLTTFGMVGALIFHTWASGIFGDKPFGAKLITRAVNNKDCSANTVDYIEPFLIKYDNFKFLGYKHYYPNIENDTETFISSCMDEQVGTV